MMDKSFILFLVNSLIFVNSFPTEVKDTQDIRTLINKNTCNFPPIYLGSEEKYAKHFQACSQPKGVLANICSSIRTESNLCDINGISQLSSNVTMELATGKENQLDYVTKKLCGYMTGLPWTVEDDCQKACSNSFFICDLYVAMDKVLRRFIEKGVQDYTHIDLFIHSGSLSSVLPYPPRGALHLYLLANCLQPTEDETVKQLCSVMGEVAVRFLKIKADVEFHEGDTVRRVMSGWDPCTGISAFTSFSASLDFTSLLQNCSSLCRDQMGICKMVYIGLEKYQNVTAGRSSLTLANPEQPTQKTADTISGQVPPAQQLAGTGSGSGQDTQQLTGTGQEQKVQQLSGTGTGQLPPVQQPTGTSTGTGQLPPAQQLTGTATNTGTGQELPQQPPTGTNTGTGQELPAQLPTGTNTVTGQELPAQLPTGTGTNTVTGQELPVQSPTGTGTNTVTGQELPVQSPTGTATNTVTGQELPVQPPAGTVGKVTQQQSETGTGQEHQVQQLPGTGTSQTQQVQQLPGTGTGETQQVQQLPATGSGQTQQVQQLPGTGTGQTQQVQQLPATGTGQEQQVQQLPATGTGETQQVQQLPVTGTGKEQQVQQLPATGPGETQQVQQLPATGTGETQHVQQLPATGTGKEQQVQQLPATGTGQTQQVQQLPPTGTGQEQQIQQLPATGTGQTQQVQQLPETGTGLAGEQPKLNGTSTTTATPSSTTTDMYEYRLDEEYYQDYEFEDPEPKKNQLDIKPAEATGQKKPLQTKLDKSVGYAAGDEDSSGGHFMAYFLVFIVLSIAGYIVFHNKQKIIALVIEGKTGRGGRRPNTKDYKQVKTDDVMPDLEKSAYSKNYVF